MPGMSDEEGTLTMENQSGQRWSAESTALPQSGRHADALVMQEPSHRNLSSSPSLDCSAPEVDGQAIISNPTLRSSHDSS